jgi:hypothetical protein
MRIPLALALAALAAIMLAGCSTGGAELVPDETIENYYSGGSIPPGKGPVTAAGYVVDATAERMPLEGAEVTIKYNEGSTVAARTTVRTTTNANGIFYIDEIPAGEVEIEVRGPDDYERVDVEVDASQASVISASMATYRKADKDKAPSDEELDDFLSDMPDEIEEGTTYHPGKALGLTKFEHYLSYVCASESIVVNRDGSLTAVAQGEFELSGKYKTKKSKKRATVTPPGLGGNPPPGHGGTPPGLSAD